MDVAARLEAIEAENAVLRERVAQLEVLLGHHFMPPIEWRLTASEARVFGCLLARDIATKEAILAALYRDLGKDEAEIKIVDVFICKLRKKVVPFGVEVKTRWGEGYFLTPATKETVRAAMQAVGIAA